MTRRHRLRKLEARDKTPEPVIVVITRRIVDCAHDGELRTVKTEQRTFTVKPDGAQ